MDERPLPTERDLRDAAKFRERIHQEALDRVRRFYPDVTDVYDPHPVDAYFEWKWDYPGAWYLYVSVPEGYKSRDALVNAIVRATIDHMGQPRKPH